jgi:branched-chain amino acid transport system permease protein
LFGALVSSAYTTAAAFLVLLAFLVLRPRGLAAR